MSVCSVSSQQNVIKARSPLLQYAKNITSQGGEDGILLKIFEYLVDDTTPHYLVDIGAWDGKHLSNSYTLMTEKMWGGILFEADYERYQLLYKLYSTRDDIDTQCCLVDCSSDKKNSLVELFKSSKSSIELPHDFDFLSIDIDGADYHLWNSLADTPYQPKVVCIEFNPSIPNNIAFIQENDISIQQGSSLLSIMQLGKSLGYQCIVTTTFNAIFIRNDQLSKLPSNLLPHPNYCTPMDLNESSFFTYIFQTYDGEIKALGVKKLIWHKLGIPIQKIQVLNKKNRKFPCAPPASGNDGGGGDNGDGDDEKYINSYYELAKQYFTRPSGCHSIDDMVWYKLLNAIQRMFMIPYLQGHGVMIIEYIVGHLLGSLLSSNQSSCSNDYDRYFDVIDLMINRGHQIKRSQPDQALQKYQQALTILLLLSQSISSSSSSSSSTDSESKIDINIDDLYDTYYNRLSIISNNAYDISRQRQDFLLDSMLYKGILNSISPTSNKCDHSSNVNVRVIQSQISSSLKRTTKSIIDGIHLENLAMSNITYNDDDYNDNASGDNDNNDMKKGYNQITQTSPPPSVTSALPPLLQTSCFIGLGILIGMTISKFK